MNRRQRSLRHDMERECVDHFMALGRNNGSRRKPPYTIAVLAVQRSWQSRDDPTAPAAL